MYGRANIGMMRSLRQDPSVTHQKLKPGTVRRIIGYAKPYKLWLVLFLFATIIDALITVVNPVLLRQDHRQGHPAPRRSGRDRARCSGRSGRAVRRAPRVRHPLVLRADRRRTHLRPAHPGVQSRPAAAHRVLHPGADRIPGVPPEQRRDRSAAGHHLHDVLGGLQHPHHRRDPGHDVLRVLADQPHRAGADPPVHPPGPAGRPQAAAADPRIDAARRGDGLDHDRAFQRGGRDARQALRPPP